MKKTVKNSKSHYRIRIHIVQATNMVWHYKLVSHNQNTLCVSEAYNHAKNAKEAARNLLKCLKKHGFEILD